MPRTTYAYKVVSFLEKFIDAREGLLAKACAACPTVVENDGPKLVSIKVLEYRKKRKFGVNGGKLLVGSLADSSGAGQRVETSVESHMRYKAVMRQRACAVVWAAALQVT
ncbi:hypothetical protein Zmor_009062 [Zophobas morio]|jgi:hypothetical protein|uniref:Uncharacterized protein n=1 Tax=Zophobas morio TaxID=2755281 RepID=A0AA38LYX2_9CUCU|nr:hypothetical protein Zmor_009062 [Zophobas morio]